MGGSAHTCGFMQISWGSNIINKSLGGRNIPEVVKIKKSHGPPEPHVFNGSNHAFTQHILSTGHHEARQNCRCEPRPRSLAVCAAFCSCPLDNSVGFAASTFEEGVGRLAHCRRSSRCAGMTITVHFDPSFESHRELSQGSRQNVGSSSALCRLYQSSIRTKAIQE